MIGSNYILSIGGYANWTNVSDGRVKKNIKQNVPGLKFINKLQPVTYNLDLDAADQIIQRPAMKDRDGKIIQPSAQQLEARQAKQQILYSGFVAQDVEKAAKELNYNFSGVDAAKNEHDLYGLRYSDFVVPLVKAVQELNKMSHDKDAKINDLQRQLDELKAMIMSGATSNIKPQTSIITEASLQQNIPNPFNHTTTINYTLPQTYASAKIIVTDKSGKMLKQISLENIKGNINVDASTLASGAYRYSLYVDGRLIDTKEMVLAK